MAVNYRSGYLKSLDGGKLYERELMRILLGNAFGGKDMSAVADALLDCFPSVRAATEAEFAELMSVDGVTERIATYLITVGRVFAEKGKEDVFVRNTEDCFKLAFERLRGKDNEHAEVYFVNKRGKVLDIKTFTSDKIDKVIISAKSVFMPIAALGASGVYFVHNHVGTSATPSAEDDRSTAKMVRACAMCSVTLLDHCIVNSRGERFSYRDSGRMDNLV